MSHRADMAKLMRKLKQLDCEVDRTRGGHWKITTPNGAVVIAAFSPRAPGSVNATIQRLRKEGVPL